MSSLAVKTWRRNTKARFVKALGDCCQICNYSKCQNALELHHINPDEKEFSFGRIMANPRKLELLLEEASKCILLCSNCHREVHAGTTNLPEVYKTLDRSVFYPDKKLLQNPCPTCNELKPITKNFCSHKCSQVSRQTNNWSEIDLIDLIQNQKIPMIKLGIRFGVSDNAVRKQYLKQLKNHKLQELDSNQ